VRDRREKNAREQEQNTDITQTIGFPAVTALTVSDERPETYERPDPVERPET
jgi:hypothetical protein